MVKFSLVGQRWRYSPDCSRKPAKTVCLCEGIHNRQTGHGHENKDKLNYSRRT